MHDARIIFVPLKQLLAVREKTLLGYAVVFKDNSVLDIFKNPGNAGRNAHFAPHVYVRVISLYFALPVDMLGDRASGISFFFFLFCTRAVRNNKKLCRARLSNFCKHPSRLFWAIKYHERYRRVECRFRHCEY